MEINTILKFKFKDQEFELTLEEAKELQKELNKILAEPAPTTIWVNPNQTYKYGDITIPYQIPITAPTYPRSPWIITCENKDNTNLTSDTVSGILPITNGGWSK